MLEQLRSFHDGVVFPAVWICLMGAWLAFWQSRPVAMREKWRLVSNGFVALSFLALVFLSAGLNNFALAIIPAGLIFFLNVKTSKLCHACGAGNRNPYMFPTPRFCSRCGSRLK